ncbi:MAG: c-type cytochrome [Gallionellaceae bacterium]
MMSGHAFAEEDLSEIQSAGPETAALALVRNHGCFTCHAIDRKVIGPAWKDVATKYRDDPGAEARLVDKVSNGGKGVWGDELAMPPLWPLRCRG